MESRPFEPDRIWELLQIVAMTQLTLDWTSLTVIRRSGSFHRMDIRIRLKVLP